MSYKLLPSCLLALLLVFGFESHAQTNIQPLFQAIDNNDVESLKLGLQQEMLSFEQVSQLHGYAVDSMKKVNINWTVPAVAGGLGLVADLVAIVLFSMVKNYTYDPARPTEPGTQIDNRYKYGLLGTLLAGGTSSIGVGIWSGVTAINNHKNIKQKKIDMIDILLQKLNEIAPSDTFIN